jgi:hypothetical protein
MNSVPPSDGEAFTLCEMQTKLNADEKGQYSDELRAFFEMSFNQVKASVDAGLAPDEFDKHQKLLEATALAAGIVDSYWKILYGRD